MEHTVQISRSEGVTPKEIIEVGFLPTQIFAVTSSLSKQNMICNDPRSQINRVPNLYSGRGHTMVMVQLSHGWWVSKGLAWRKDVLKQKHKRNSKGRPWLLRQAYDIETSSIIRLLENSRNRSRSLVPSLGYQGESVCNLSRVKNRDIISVLLVIHQERKGKSQTPIGMDSVKVHFQSKMCTCVHMCTCVCTCVLCICMCTCTFIGRWDFERACVISSDRCRIEQWSRVGEVLQVWVKDLV